MQTTQLTSEDITLANNMSTNIAMMNINVETPVFKDRKHINEDVPIQFASP